MDGWKVFGLRNEKVELKSMEMRKTAGRAELLRVEVKRSFLDLLGL